MAETTGAGRLPVHRFFIALAFFTRLPCPAWVAYAPEYQRRAACFAPLVGWLVGAVAALVLAAAALVLPLPVAVVLSMAAATWLTGALHEDGFADVCDAFGGGRDPERIREILKDPRIGVFGAVGLLLLLLLRFALLTEIAAAGMAVAAAVLLAGHSVSRLAAVALMATHDYAGAPGGPRSGAIASRMRAGDLLFAAGCGLAPLLPFIALGMPRLLLAAVPAALAWLWLARLFLRRLGGYSGDCLGCTQQVTEAAFYLAACALLYGG